MVIFENKLTNLENLFQKLHNFFKGSTRLYFDVQKQKKQLWNSHLCFVPSRLIYETIQLDMWISLFGISEYNFYDLLLHNTLFSYKTFHICKNFSRKFSFLYLNKGYHLSIFLK